VTLDRRTAQALLLVDETCSRIARLVARGRAAFDQDEALFDACQLGIVRLNTDLDRLGREWLAAHPDIPRDRVRGLRNRIGHDYHSVDADILWIVVSTSVPELHRMLGPEIAEARRVLTR
jgi:uncharacterized protein with HEPN domain